VSLPANTVLRVSLNDTLGSDRSREGNGMNLREEALALWDQKQREQAGQGAAHAEGHRERRRVTLQKQLAHQQLSSIVVNLSQVPI
jgi:hypothetical protein